MSTFQQRRKANPFLSNHVPGIGDAEAVDVETRLERVKNFSESQCRAALKRDGLQATVRKAIERRLRQLEKEVKS